MSESKKVVGWSVVCLLIMSVVAHAADVAREGREPGAAVGRGLDWLAAHQQENGGWSNENYPGVSALALWAFAVSDHPDKEAICERAATFIVSFAQEDGGIYKPATGGRGSGGLSTYNTAICMMALKYHAPAKYAQMLIKARDSLSKSQLRGDSPASGGFGYDQLPPPGRPPMADLSNSGWAMQAMRETEYLKEHLKEGQAWSDLDWEAARSFVEKLQIQDAQDPQNDGGFTYNTGGDRNPFQRPGSHEEPVKLCGFGSMTYAGIESMIYAEVDASDARVRSALAWAGKNWSVKENPGMGLKGLYYYYTIMSKALTIARCSELEGPSGAIDWRAQLVEQLMETQQEDGSWYNEDNSFWEADPCLVTAYAILSLHYAVEQ